MSVITMAKTIKQVHPEFTVMYKTGAFYNAYGKDAYILSYLFNYNVKTNAENVSISGFPERSISKVKASLENKKINYMIITPKNNYNVDEEMDFKNLNKYKEVFEKAQKIVSLRKRVNNITEMLLNQLDIEKITEIEKIIYED